MLSVSSELSSELEFECLSLKMKMGRFDCKVKEFLLLFSELKQGVQRRAARRGC